MTSQGGVEKASSWCVVHPEMARSLDFLLYPRIWGKFHRRGGDAKSGRTGWRVPGEQSEKRSSGQKEQYIKKMWNTECETSRGQTRNTLCFVAEELGLILRAVAVYEDFGSACAFETG